MAFTETARKKFRVMSTSTPGVAAGTCTITPADTPTQSSQTNTINVPGVRIGDAVLITKSAGGAGLIVDMAMVNAINTISIRLRNTTGGTIVAGAFSFSFLVIRN